MDTKIKFEASYTGMEEKAASVTLARVLPQDADLGIVLGEMLYGISSQTHDFETHEVYESVVEQLPECESLKVNKPFKMTVHISGKADISLVIKRVKA